MSSTAVSPEPLSPQKEPMVQLVRPNIPEKETVLTTSTGNHGLGSIVQGEETRSNDKITSGAESS
jgi:hypothetical protein